MSREGLPLPPPTIFGSKPKPPRQEQHQIHIQVPCQISRFVDQKWDLIATNVIVQLVKQATQKSLGGTVEYLRVLDIQSQPIVDQPLTEMKWGQLAELAYELDTLRNEELDKVYAITFLSEPDALHFNQVFEEKNKQSEISSNALYPFLAPLTDAIQRGDIEEAVKRFNYLCEFPPEQRKFSIRAETPLTPEQIKQQKSVNVNITVENYEGIQTEIILSVPKESTIADLKETMYNSYEIPLEVQKWLGEQCLFKNSDRVMDNTGQPKKIYLYILNAAKVGLNRGDFMAKLEAYRNNLKQKKLPATVINPQQQQQQQQQQYQRQYQQQQPLDEDDVPIGPPMTPYGNASFNIPVGSIKPNLTQDPYSQLPVSSEIDPNTQEQSGEPKVLPGVYWTCTCNHVNAWENNRCERCRNDRPPVA